MAADSRSPYYWGRLWQKGTKQNLILLVKKLVIVCISLVALFILLNYIFPLNDTIEYSTIITDNRGEVINGYLTKDEKWRMKTELKEISPLLKKAIIAKEDKYFYYHPGVNPFAVARAAFMNIFHLRRTSGASTITMQVARALTHRKRTFSSKVVEMFRAVQLELKYSKDEILQMYLNLVPYGGNIEGVKAASILYFKTDPDHLSLAQIIALSVIPNRPSTLVIGRRNDQIVKARNVWLNKLADEKFFTRQEVADAISEPLTAKRTVVPHLLPHLCNKLKVLGSENLINTTIDLPVQAKVEKLTAEYIHALKAGNIHNAAVIIVNNATNEVITYVGSADFTDTSDGGQVNGAAAVRQPGSTLKPLLYGLCIDAGLLTPKTIINDIPVNFSGYNPENYDKKFNGAVTLEYALDHSLNIPAVKSLNLLGKEKLIGKLIACDFTQIQKDQHKLGLSLILGGCGATLEQLTGLFSAFAHEGVYIKPGITGVSKKKVQLLSADAAYMITDILSRVNRPDFPLTWSVTEHMPKIAWKTGTSYGRKDAWSIGYNKNFTVGVWVGNFSGIGVAELSGANTATPLLFRIFNTIDYDSNQDWYEPPAGCELRQVCSESGLPPGPLCTNFISDCFIPLVSSTKTCNHLQEIKISADRKHSFCETCAPASGYIKKYYRNISPEMQEYFLQKNIAFEQVPPHNPECERIFRGDGPKIISPKNATEYYINKKDPEPIQLIGAGGSEVATLYWYIDDKFYKTTRSGEKQFFIPHEGRIKISCTDDKGRNRNIYITSRYINF